MYPYLLESLLGESVIIPTYGLALALAFTLGYLEAIRRSFKQGVDPKHMERLFLIVIVGSLFGARLFHAAFEEFAYYRDNPARLIAVWEGGFTFYGGLFVSMGLVFGYTRWKRLSFKAILDILTPSVLLGLSIGRIGCFLAGCCWGTTTAMPWGVEYWHRHTLSAIKYVPVHPVQLYESVGCLLLFILTLRVFRTKPAEGSIFFLGLGGYACLRFVVEFFRGDEYRGFVLNGSLSFAQFLSLAILLLLGLDLAQRRRQSAF